MSGHRVLHDMYQAPFLMRDPGASGLIVVDRYAAFCSLVSATAETRTLAAPTKAGIRCIVCLGTDGGDVTLTVTGGYNNDDDTSIVFGDAGDFVEFVSIKEGPSYYWRVTAQEGTNAVVEDIQADTAEITTLVATALTATQFNYTPVARTATADGLTTGTIADAGMLQFVTVTSASADNIIVLPTPVAGKIVILWVGANGYELRSSTPTSVAINGGSGASAESAIAANQMVVVICTSTTSWHGFEITAATLSAVEAAA